MIYIVIYPAVGVSKLLLTPARHSLRAPVHPKQARPKSRTLSKQLLRCLPPGGARLSPHGDASTIIRIIHRGRQKEEEDRHDEQLLIGIIGIITF